MTPAAGWALCAFAAALPLSIAGANIGWGLVLAALLWQARRGASDLGPATALAAPLALYVLVAALSGALGTDPRESFRHFHQDVHKLWLTLLLAAALKAAPGRRPLGWLATGFAAAAVIGIFQAMPSVLAGAGMNAWDKVRAHAFVHPVTFGEQMTVALLGAAAFAEAPPAGAPRAAALGLGALYAAALALSGTRGAVLGAAAGLWSMLAARPERRRWAAAVAAAALVALVAIDVWVPERSVLLQALGVTHPHGFGGDQLTRLTLWEVSLRMWRDHPWLGSGPNTFRAQLPRYVTMRFEDFSNSWGTAHDLYLHHLAERGLAGLGATLWLLGTLLAGAWRRAGRDGDPWQAWALGTAVAFAVMNLTEVALQVEIVWMLVWFVWLWAEARAAAGTAADAD